MILRASSKFSEKPSLIAPNLKRVSGDTGVWAVLATPAVSDADPERIPSLFQNARRFMTRSQTLTACSRICSAAGSQYSRFPDQQDWAAMMHTIACEQP